MKKQILFFAVAALALASCSSENDVVQSPNAVEQTADDGAINFGVYVNRSTTRAGVPGSIDNTTIKNSAHDHGTQGFAVFGYYTDNSTYSKYALPDFMYNQKVTWNDTKSAWVYEPVKYWPNEFGDDANSYDQDHVSFFAYAPYVQVDAATGIPNESGVDITKNITRMTSNTTTGDPYIKYIVDTDPTTSVDLLWGVAPATTTYATVNGPTASTVLPGEPYKDLLKAQVASKVNFELRHALAKLNVSIDAFVDGINNTNTLDEKTRIYVRSVTFSGFALQGSLNLNNEDANKPNWYEYDGVKQINTGGSADAITFYDGRRDNKEGAANGEQKNEKPQGLNRCLIQNENGISAGSYVTASTARDASPYIPSGVTNETVNLFDTDADEASPIFVIPTDDQMNITIVYDVETIDPNLSTYLSDGVTHGSTIENRIYKEDIFEGNSIEAGKAYQVNLHLGMTSVKFDANVVDWEDLGTKEVNLPHNTPSASATATTGGGATESLTIPAGTYTGAFAVDGLTPTTGGEITLAGGLSFKSLNGVSPAPSTQSIEIKADGLANVNYELNANNSVNDVTGTITVTDNASPDAKSATLTITQKAAPLGLSITTAAQAGQKDIVIATTGTVTTTDWGSAIISVLRKRNGTTTALSKVAPSASSGEFSFDAASTTISLGDEAVAGDVYTITIAAGNADEETVSFTVVKQSATISFSSTTASVSTSTTDAIGGCLSAVLKHDDTTLTPDGDKVNGAAIEYTKSGTGSENFDFDTTDPYKLKAKSGTVAGDYTFKIKATVTDGTWYTYGASNTAEYDITVTVSTVIP